VDSKTESNAGKKTKGPRVIAKAGGGRTYEVRSSEEKKKILAGPASFYGLRNGAKLAPDLANQASPACLTAEQTPQKFR